MLKQNVVMRPTELVEMQTSFTSLFFDKIIHVEVKENWQKAILYFLQKKEFPEDKWYALEKDLISCEFPEDFFQFKLLRRLLIFNLVLQISPRAYRNEELLRRCFRKIQQNAEPCLGSLRVNAGLEVLNGYFLNYPASSQLCDLFLMKIHEELTLSPHLQVELALLTAIAAQIFDRPELLSSVYKIAERQIHFLDHKYFPMMSIYTKEKEYFPEETLAFNYVLFHLCSRWDEKFSALAGSQWSHLHSLFHQNPQFEWPFFPFIIHLWLERFSIPESKMPFLPGVISQKKNCDPHYGWIGEKQEHSSLFLTLSGENTGLGVFQKKETAILNFGPHQSNILEMEKFGFSQPGFQNEKSSPQINSSNFSIRGWGRLQKIRDADPLWMEMNAQLQQGRLHLKVHFNPLKNLSSLYFSFFIQAELAIIGDKAQEALQIKLTPGSLESYKGNSTFVRFQGKDEMLTIEALQLLSMQLIPLAGGKHFWGANFLLVFAMSEAYEDFIWTIT